MMEPTRLSAWIASFLLHDIASPLTSLTLGETAFDETADPQVRAESAKLVVGGIKGLVSKVEYLRLALGSRGLEDARISAGEVHALFVQLFAAKPTLDWAIGPPDLTMRQARLLMNMALIARSPVATTGGVLRVEARREGDDLVLTTQALGARSGFRPEIVEALSGRDPAKGWEGGSAHALFTRLDGAAIGFPVELRAEEGALVARGPA
jgi:hypothetical protein